MKRRHLARDIRRFVEEARRRRPDVIFGADMIAGFPTEDESAHQQSLALIEACDIPLLHVFGFSPREGTPAARMPQLDGGIIKQRSRELRALGTRLLHQTLDNLVGSQDELLFEKGNQGHLRNFIKAKITGDTFYASGTLLAVKVIARDEDMVVVEPQDTDDKGAL